MHKRGACVLWCLLTSPSLCPCHLRIVCRASTVPLSNLSELRIWTFCWELGVLCAIVHPGRWIMRLTSPPKACQQTPFLSASLHQCMFGTYRRKATHVVAGWPLVSPHPANLWRNLPPLVPEFARLVRVSGPANACLARESPSLSRPSRCRPRFVVSLTCAHYPREPSAKPDLVCLEVWFACCGQLWFYFGCVPWWSFGGGPR